MKPCPRCRVSLPGHFQSCPYCHARFPAGPGAAIHIGLALLLAAVILAGWILWG